MTLEQQQLRPKQRQPKPKVKLKVQPFKQLINPSISDLKKRKNWSLILPLTLWESLTKNLADSVEGKLEGCSFQKRFTYTNTLNNLRRKYKAHR